MDMYVCMYVHFAQVLLSANNEMPNPFQRARPERKKGEYEQFLQDSAGASVADRLQIVYVYPPAL
jgi:hypothetical protein